MIRLYPATMAKSIMLPKLPRFVFTTSIFITLFSFTASSQALSFQHPVLQSGVDGKDGAIYRFSNINDTLDALVKINGRSTTKVTLVSIDDTTAGYKTAFQPIVTYNNDMVTSATDWWMDFSITYVRTGTSTPVTLMSFSSSALDIDGNGSKISEYVSFYYMQTYFLPDEDNSDITVSDLQEFVGDSFSLIGEKLVGPSTNYPGIDSANTSVMVSMLYSNISSFRVRTGAQSTSASTGATRDYSFTFATVAAAAATLPVELTSFNATVAPKGVALSWTTAREINTSNFVIERSFDGVNYSDAAMLFTEGKGNSNIEIDYNYTDKVNTTSQALIYYRLRMVDIDGRYKHSSVVVVKVGKGAEAPVVSVYPNPVVNSVFVSVPATWQNKPLSVEVYSNNGQLMKHVSNSSAGQTEMVNVKDLTGGMYIVRVSNGTQIATQKIVKTN